MNKLVESKLRRLVQKEIKSVLKEAVDTNYQDEFNRLIAILGISGNPGDHYMGEITVYAVERTNSPYKQYGDSVGWFLTKNIAEQCKKFMQDNDLHKAKYTVETITIDDVTIEKLKDYVKQFK